VLGAIKVRTNVNSWRDISLRGDVSQILETGFYSWRRVSFITGKYSSERGISLPSPGGFRGSESGIITCEGSPDITCGYLYISHFKIPDGDIIACIHQEKQTTNSGGNVKTTLFGSINGEDLQNNPPSKYPKRKLISHPRLPSLENNP
jgi:hypothetical protein